jgi:hypothetical protein
MNPWGWGAPIVAYFNLNRINVVKPAFGGTSSRSFYAGFFWRICGRKSRRAMSSSFMFGANDNGGAAGNGALRGTGAETESIERGGKTETVHTFGWYLRQFVKEVREQGATPILCSLTPRKAWTDDGRFRRDTHHACCLDFRSRAGDRCAVQLIFTNIIARKYETLGPAKVGYAFRAFVCERLHTGWMAQL